MSECKRVRDLVGAYLYADLPAREQARVELHLKRCDACRQEVEALRSLLQQIPSDLGAMPADAAERVQRAMHDRLIARPRMSRGWPRWSRVIIGAAAASAVLWVVGRLPHAPPVAPQPPPMETATQPLPPAPMESAEPGAPPRAGLPAPPAGHVSSRPRPPRQPPPAQVRNRQSPAERPQTVAQVPPGSPSSSPTRGAQVNVPPLMAPRPVGVDDVTVTPQPPEQD